MSKQSEFIKVKDAARRIGIRTETMYDWINRGYVPAHRFGRFVRILASDFEEYLNRTRINDGSIKQRNE
ncbi:MAG: helix-turn-helix domain-containing protein [Patescibacteria group bacterium]